MFNKLFFLFSFIFVGQISYCPDESYFFVLPYGPPHHVRNRYRLDMQNCTKTEAVLALRKHFDVCREAQDSLDKAKSKALQRKAEGRWSDFSLVEQKGSMPVNDERAVNFSFLYGFDSEEQASAYGPGNQIFVSEVFEN